MTQIGTPTSHGWAGWWWGRRVTPEAAWIDILADVFGRPREVISAVAVYEGSRFARLHLGAIATTRPGAIYLAGDAQSFWHQPQLVLHEYRHVLDQWGRTLTRLAYLREALRHGYARNAFECDAIEFAREQAPRVLALMDAHARMG